MRLLVKGMYSIISCTYRSGKKNQGQKQNNLRSASQRAGGWHVLFGAVRLGLRQLGGRAASLKSGHGPQAPLGRGIAARQFSPLRRTEALPFRPPALCRRHKHPAIYGVLWLSHFFDLVDQNGSTWPKTCSKTGASWPNIAPRWPNMARKLVLHSPKMGQHSPEVCQHALVGRVPLHCDRPPDQRSPSYGFANDDPPYTPGEPKSRPDFLNLHPTTVLVGTLHRRTSATTIKAQPLPKAGGNHIIHRQQPQIKVGGTILPAKATILPTNPILLHTFRQRHLPTQNLSPPSPVTIIPISPSPLLRARRRRSLNTLLNLQTKTSHHG